MRIALIYDAAYPWHPGGGEKSLRELAEDLRDRGHEVHLFAMHAWDGPADQVRDGLHYHGVCPALPLYKADGRRATWPPLRFALGLFAALLRAKPGRFDVVDVHAFPFFSVPACRLALAFSGRRVPWLVTWLEVWGGDYWRRYLGRLGPIGAMFERLCARLGPAHLCISETTADRLHDLLGVPRDRIRAIPRGFAPPAIGVSTLPARVPGRVVVVGRLIEYKRVDLLIRSWPAVLRQRPESRLLVIGDGPERAALERLVASEGVSGSVDFLGNLSSVTVVAELIPSAEVLALPSSREGQSLAVLEALSLGTPVVAADGPESAVGEFLRPIDGGEQTLLPVEAGPDAWASRIVRLLGDAGLRSRLASDGRLVAASLDRRRAIAPRVEDFYRDVIESAGRKAPGPVEPHPIDRDADERLLPLGTPTASGRVR